MGNFFDPERVKRRRRILKIVGIGVLAVGGLVGLAVLVF